MLGAGWTWWHMPVIPACGRERQKDPEFQTSLRDTMKTCLKKTEENKNQCVVFAMGCFGEK